MTTHTKTLFSSILKALDADCVCDVGSRDGDQALLFKQLLPNARVLAFEANPLNFERMAAKEALKHFGIELFPYAVSNRTGRATFHITDVDYDAPDANIGTSSLLLHQGLSIRQSIEVDVFRIDDFILNRFPDVKRIGLWIDVEGAEYGVLEGMAGVKDRILAMHVETAKQPMRVGQRTYDEVKELANTMGFSLAGTNIGAQSRWGDVVFVSDQARKNLGRQWATCCARAHAAKWFAADKLAVSLKTRWPWLYRRLRSAYIKTGM